MKLLKCILTENDCYKAGKKITPKGIMVHSTGANNPNLKRYVQPNVDGIGVNNNGNHWNRAGVKKCVHAFIGKLADGSIATVQTLPWDHRAWHCGDDGNNTHISFEICEDALKNAEYFGKVYQEAVELCAYLCKQYKLDPSTIICHSEGNKLGIASAHADVEHWFPKFGKSMNDFRKDVSALTKVESVKLEGAKHYSRANNAFFTVTTDLNMRYGAGTSKAVVTVLPKGTKFKCYGYYTKLPDGTIWLYGVAGGKKGFCSKKYLKQWR